jgi:hypothetical protein
MKPAYLEGVEARKNGKAKGSNPYAKLTRNHNIRLWNMGWSDQNKEQRDAEEN